MILIDNSQIILSTIFAQYNTPDAVTVDLVRHLTLSSYRMYRNMFHGEYGELVLCQDTSNCWRKEVFPEYKHGRKKSREKSQYDWEGVFDILNIIRNEVKEFLPYKSLAIPRCEADDIIAVLTKNFHQTEKVMIVSSDKDFQQLLRFQNVQQYSPMKRSIIKCESPERFLFEHIIKGDTSDGIPNILSDDNTFVFEGKRQKPLSSKKLLTWKTFSDIPQQYERNIDRNRMLVDLAYIPIDVENSILEEYKVPPVGERKKIFDYFVDKRLKNLMDNIQDF